jgi:acyl-CoA synthetase (AMP-forming)/AMP-acid ligase II
VTATWSGLVRAQARDSDLAVVTPEDGWTWSRLLASAGGAARFLIESGLPEGRPVPALTGHPGEALALTLGGAACRRPLAPLGPRLTATELAACVQRLGAAAIVSAPRHLSLAADVARLCGCRVAAVEALPGGPLPGAPGPDDVALVLHTSGTSGLPKAVPLTERCMAARARLLAGMTRLGRGDTYLTASGFHHIAGGGNLATGLALGAAVASFDQFSTAAWLALRRVRITHAILVPAMIHTLLADGALSAHPDLRQLIYGGGPIHPQTLLDTIDALPGADLVQLFGQTEGSPISVVTAADHRRIRAGRPDLLASAGRAVPGVELVIDRPDADGVGEVWCRAGHMSVVDDENWRHTGDLGRLDAEGYLFLAGRAGDTINRGGENVRPLEVEDVLRAHPEVADVAVVGIPDRRLGEVVAAFVVAAEPAREPDWEQLRAHARSRLAGFKVPAVWRLVDELPRNPTGKLLRRVLRDQWPVAP